MDMTGAPRAAEIAPLPPLPAVITPEGLRDLDDPSLGALVEELGMAERATLAAMAPYTRQVAEVRARQSEIATERRRRERSARHAQRREVRAQAGSDALPSLSDALETEPSPFDLELPLSGLPGFLRTGGEVGFGFASRPGSITFTDGRQTRPARTWGEAREAHAGGWEPGTPGIAGVRVHLAGTKVERVVPAADVLVRVPGLGRADAG